jgi:hypothetical protein
MLVEIYVSPKTCKSLAVKAELHLSLYLQLLTLQMTCGKHSMELFNEVRKKKMNDLINFIKFDANAIAINI